MTEIALFGTSADPPTSGHQTILRWLSNHYDWVAVWASDNPFKQHQTPLEHRMMMLRLVIMEIEAPRHNISLNRELSHPRSLTTVQKAREIWGDEVNLNLVIGADLIPQLPRWYNVETLLKQVQLLIVPRFGYAIDPEGLAQLETLGGNYAIADLNAPGVSSSAYREEGDQSVVIPLVQDYIHQQQLYAS
ncbi:nicotinate-nucleotide adenylyltransferase [Spirulina subsalsa FACHB-351]|uniref:nicotinate-nucleotide adenylyltransferase n=1 Tax=Spirulina subsalsa FACHB-351 TaxID=234711 RepID=A0ABT3L1L6_9CYAN|nr:nicotinate-nucleotide adenylyltransferase [Spirulina subsalsa]MCW6035392.1 nicotinate-nucleotide adenylyltransferase [Spirulina subsalsa FACHB-351]